jgi:hypothetical protein
MQAVCQFRALERRVLIFVRIRVRWCAWHTEIVTLRSGVVYSALETQKRV